MPLVRDRCDCCGEVKPACPECGSHHVTPRETIHRYPPNHYVDYGWLTEEEDGGKVVYEHVCWDCGWDETVTIKITRS